MPADRRLFERLGLRPMVPEIDERTVHSE